MLKATVAAIAVATPLPPLKEKNIGKQWPKKALKAVTAIQMGLVKMTVAIRTGIKPFKQSPSKVKKAAFFPAMRSTFVAPGLFDPSLRGSGNPIIRDSIIADETDPNR